MSRTYRDSSYFTYRSNLANDQRSYGWHHKYESDSIADPQEYYKWSRDCWSETTQNNGIKEDTNRIIRSKNKKCIHKLMKDVDAFEDMDFATKMDGKTLFWYYW